MEAFLPLLVALPLGVAFAIVIFAHVPALKRVTSVLPALVVLANLVIAVNLLRFGELRLFVGKWGGGSTLGIEMVCDGFTKLMLVTINFVSLAAVVFAGPYMKRFTKLWLFESLFLLMTGAMNAVVLAGDLFNLFVFIEVAAIASYALVAFGTEAEELEAAFKYLVLGTIGSAFILLGVTVIYSLTGHLNMKVVADALRGVSSPAVMLAAAALIGGFALKAAMVPFHAWLPDAHPAAPAPISAMLSGVLIKASGIYAVARIVFNVLGPSTQYAHILIFLGAASMVVGMFLALGQWDLKRLLAYSSVSQAGYVVLALGVAAYLKAAGAPQGRNWLPGLCLFGGLFHLFNHATFKSLLFLSSGSIEHQVGTRQLGEMGGLTRSMPVTSFCCRVGALSISGVPPFNGFFSKLIIIIALALAEQYALAALAAGVAVGTLLMYVKVQRYALEGMPAGRTLNAREAPVLMCAALVLLAVVCVAAGLALVPLKTYLFDPASRALLGAAP